MTDDESSSFESMEVPELQNFLKARDIRRALDGKKRKRVELLELCKNAAEMKVPKVDEKIELKDEVIKSKITLLGGKLLPVHFRFSFGNTDSSLFNTSMKSSSFMAALLLTLFRRALFSGNFQSGYIFNKFNYFKLINVCLAGNR